MAAVLRVNLGEAEYLRVGQRAAQLLLYRVQVVYLLGREGEALLLVVFLKVVDVLDGLGLVVYGEDALVKPLVHALQHGVVVGVGRAYGEVLLDARNAIEVHVLGNLHGVRAPGRHHLAAGAYEAAVYVVGLEQLGAAVQPAKFFYFFLRELMVNLGRYHALRRCLEKKNHNFGYFIFVVSDG